MQRSKLSHSDQKENSNASKKIPFITELSWDKIIHFFVTLLIGFGVVWNTCQTCRQNLEPNLVSKFETPEVPQFTPLNPPHSITIYDFQTNYKRPPSNLCNKVTIWNKKGIDAKGLKVTLELSNPFIILNVFFSDEKWENYWALIQKDTKTYKHIILELLKELPVEEEVSFGFVYTYPLSSEKTGEEKDALTITVNANNVNFKKPKPLKRPLKYWHN